MPTQEDILTEIDRSNQRKFNNWMSNNTPHSTLEKPAFDNYVKEKIVLATTYDQQTIDNKIKAGGGQTPSGAGALISVPVINDADGVAIEGGYAVNLIDYRELSKDHRIGVGGKTSVQDPHQRLIYNLGKTVNSNSKYYAGGKLGMSGVKKGKEIIFDGHWHKYDNSYDIGKLTFHIDESKQGGITSQEKDFTSRDVTISQRFTPNDYGYYKIGLGSSNTQKPSHYEVHLQAYYGDFKPKGVRRNFQFKKFNNYELLSNGGGVQDSYIKGKIFDQIDKKLDKVMLKDLTWHIGLTSLPIGLENFFVVECPENMKLPTPGHTEEQESKDIADKCLTNNLCEIPATDEQLHQHENRPYFAKQLAKFPVPDGKGGTVQKWCFVIVINPEKVWDWADLLQQTEVVYPIKNAGKIHVPAGGYVLNLTNGSKIQSNLYATVTGTSDDCYLFSKSPFGFDDIKVPKHQIVSVTPNYS